MRVLALLFGMLVMVAVPSHAADTPPAIDIMLALDNSGSMKRNDPQRLLPRVVTEFAGRLGPEDRLGIVAFDQASHTLLPLSQAKANNFAAALTAALQQVNYSGRLTDIPGGLEEARKEIETHGRSDAQRIIVLLTDGDIDLGSDARNSDRKIWLRGTILPAASRQGIRIFGITLTAAADVELIQSMAEATQGNYFRLLKAEEIPAVFNGVLTRLQEIRDRQVAEQAAAERERLERVRLEGERLGRERLERERLEQERFERERLERVRLENERLERERLERERLEREQRKFGRTLWLVGGAAGTILFSVIAIVLVLRRRDNTPSISVPAARLMDLGRQTGETELRIKGPLTRIGLLDDRNDIIVKSEGMSREHALIEFKDDAFYLRDRRSTNGTFLNEVRVDPNDRSGQMLKHGDILRFGPYSFRFVIDHVLEAERAQGDGEAAVGQTVRVDQARATQRVPAGAGHPTPDDTIEKPGVARQAPTMFLSSKDNRQHTFALQNDDTSVMCSALPAALQKARITFFPNGYLKELNGYDEYWKDP